MRKFLVFSFLLMALVTPSAFADNGGGAYPDPSVLLHDTSGDVYQSNLPQCQATAVIAATIVIMKENGTTYQSARKFFENVPNSNSTALQMVNQIYKKEYAKHLSVKGAYSVYGAGCDAANQ